MDHTPAADHPPPPPAEHAPDALIMPVPAPHDAPAPYAPIPLPAAGFAQPVAPSPPAHLSPSPATSPSLSPRLSFLAPAHPQMPGALPAPVASTSAGPAYRDPAAAAPRTSIPPPAPVLPPSLHGQLPPPGVGPGGYGPASPPLASSHGHGSGIGYGYPGGPYGAPPAGPYAPPASPPPAHAPLRAHSHRHASGGARTLSGLDYVIPFRGHAHARSADGDDEKESSRHSTFKVPTQQLTVGERLEPTIKYAVDARREALAKANKTGWAMNAAIGSQVLLGALTTGLSAASPGRKTSIVVSVFGAMSTIVATYLARQRGTGEPEISKARVKELDHFLREVNAVVMDRGWKVHAKALASAASPSDGGAPYADPDARDELDDVIDDFRRRFERMLGNEAEQKGERAVAQV